MSNLTTDTAPYPRKAVAAVTAALGGALGVLVTLITATSIYGNVVMGTTGNFDTINVTTTASIKTIDATTTNSGTENATTANLTTINSTTTNATTVAATTGNITTVNATTASSTNLVVGQGTSMDKIVRATLNVNFNSLPGNTGSSTDMTLTGASIGDDCTYTVTAGDLISTTSSANLHCRISASNVCTIYAWNASSTFAFDAGMSGVSCHAISYQ
mgnify:FL=1